MKRRILVVCTGNVCRSPMAAALLADKAKQAGDEDLYEISSAGTWGLDDEPATGLAQTIMENRGLSLSRHRARTVSLALLEQADLVLVMTQGHRDSLRAEFPSCSNKVHLFTELVNRQFDIGDPYGGTLRDYTACASGLADIVERGYPHLAEMVSVAAGSR